MKIDDLLKELDDLPGGSNSSAKGSTAAAARHGRTGLLPSTSSEGKLQAAPSRQSAIAASPASPAPPIAPRPPAQLASGQGHSRAKSQPRAGVKDELDELFNDLDLDTDGHRPQSAAAAAPSAAAAAAAGVRAPLGKTSSAIASRQKCTMLFVGGCQFARGRMGAVGQLVCCDSLRCTKCDFKVEQFRDREWASDVDYLFFRNNFPTEAKLAPKMLRAPRSVAYCCQCSWLHTADERKLDFASEVRWVCAGHL